jgi:protein-L-isoaspartate(D-aspartate) O-methyltransferase
MSVICARISGVLRSSFIKAGEINHEEREGHEEFVEQNQSQLCYIFGMNRISQWLVAAFLVAAVAGCHKSPKSSSEFEVERQRMVKEQLIPRDIHDERVLTAMGKVPREEFVSEDSRTSSYADSPLPIGHDQTISQPFIVAYMTEQLHPQPTDRVLEIGTGSGYQAAVLSELVKEVYTIEIIEPLARDASTRLARLGYKNAHVKIGDGYKGWPEVAPFDAIIVTCAPDKVPQPLTDQLRDGGRMIIPVGSVGDQQLYLLKKENGELEQRAILPVRFVPMAGEAAKPKWLGTGDE